jgi:hypothetical protein
VLQCTNRAQIDPESRRRRNGDRGTQEGDNAVQVGIIDHFTPSIEETHGDAARDQNTVEFEELHTNLRRVHSWHLLDTEE